MNYLITFLKGIAMGAADVVPGVSGGTIAFITGIYDTLLESIRRINPSLFSRWKQQGFMAVFQHVNALFLISLFAGIITSIATLAKLVTWSLETYPIPTWSFFFGLILVSAYHMLRQVKVYSATRFIILVIGITFAYTITILQPIHMNPTPINIMIAGSIAICAMILPGISGSFILLLLGMYTPILTAVKAFQIEILVLFMSGCILGLLCFSHLLSWLLNKYKDMTLMFLTGLMLGTLAKIWPWKQTLSWQINAKGEQIPLLQHNLLPFDYTHITGNAAHLGLSIVMMLVAIIAVLSLEKFAHSNH